MAAGVLHVIAGVVVVVPAAVIVTCAEELKVCGVEPDEDWPAATTMTYAACSVSVPGALAVSTPVPNVANAGLDSVHCVLEVTSWVVPSLRCAMACRVTAPPTLTVAGVTLRDKRLSVVDEGLEHPANRMKKALTNTEHTRGIRGMRINLPRQRPEFRSIEAWGRGQRAQAVVRVVRHVVPPANIFVIYFGATFAHRRGM